MVKALPRGPRGHFLLGSGPDFARDQLGFYAACAREYGDVVPVRFGPRRALLLYHPDAIEEVLVTRNRDFIKSPGVRLLSRLLGNGLLLSEAGTWLRQRRLLQPAFHRQRVAAYGEVMTSLTVRRLADELRSVLGDRPPAVVDLPKLTYTEMIVNESMRLYPPAYGIAREAVNPSEVAGYPIAPGLIVIMPTWVVHRDGRWFDEPEVFRPERWADGLASRLPRFAYFPFGGGPRQCIGNAFALMEATLLLAAIAQRFRLTLEPGQRVTPTPYLSLRPEPGLRMSLARR